MKKANGQWIEIATNSAKETKKAAKMLAEEILASKLDLSGAFIIGLVGDLGSGKTTFAQGFAEGLGIMKEKVLSPTFVLMRQYPLKKRNFKTFIHIDCYRLKDAKELEALGWSDLAANPKNIILIEWADRVKTILPATRIITISS
jgi:tRNA threonylcarbamoyladenosine biosynthesis protein TsaE